MTLDMSTQMVGKMKLGHTLFLMPKRLVGRRLHHDGAWPDHGDGALWRPCASGRLRLHRPSSDDQRQQSKHMQLASGRTPARQWPTRWMAIGAEYEQVLAEQCGATGAPSLPSSFSPIGRAWRPSEPDHPSAISSAVRMKPARCSPAGTELPSNDPTQPHCPSARDRTGTSHGKLMRVGKKIIGGW